MTSCLEWERGEGKGRWREREGWRKREDVPPSPPAAGAPMGCARAARDPLALQTSAPGQFVCKRHSVGLVWVRTESHSNQTAQILPQLPSVHSSTGAFSTREELASSFISLHTDMALSFKELPGHTPKIASNTPEPRAVTPIPQGS